MQEKELIIDIKEVVLKQSYLYYSDISLTEIDSIAWFYVKNKYKHEEKQEYYGGSKLVKLYWQIAVNLAYHLVQGNFIKFNTEPEAIYSLKEEYKIKWRIEHYIKPLVASNPANKNQNGVWWQFFEITDFCEKFMIRSEESKIENANETFFQNIIDYFKIDNLTEWIEKPTLKIDESKIYVESKDRF